MPALLIVVVVVLAGVAGLAVLAAGLARRIAGLRAQLAVSQQRMDAIDGALAALRTRSGAAE